jgi:hypothetical protein
MNISLKDCDGRRPWEQPGAVRRDVEPDRGPTLILLGVVTLFWGLSSLVLCLPGPVSFLFVMVTIGMASNDRRRMHQGQRDPRGLRQVRRAENLAFAGMALTVTGWVVFPLLLWLLTNE